MKTLLKPLSITLCFILTLFAALPAISQSIPSAALQPRITAPIDNSSRATLAGSRPLRANPANDAGAVSPSTKLQGISMVFSRSAEQQTTLNALLAAQQNPSSPLYHHWLTPEQYAAQFGAAPADVSAVEAWLEQQGFSVDSVSRSRNRIFFSGTAAQVASAFEAPLHQYQTPATAEKPAETHFAPSTDLTIPSAFASSILSVDNLTDFRPHSHLKMHPAQEQPRFTIAGNQDYFLTPPDVETIYDVNPAIGQGYNGSGQTIAVVGQSAVVASDITTFQTLLGLTAKAPGITLVPGTGTSATVSGDETESDIDLEYSSALAPGAAVNFYYTGDMKNTGVFDALQYVVDNDLAPIISISYGDCEFDTTAASIASFDSAVLEQAASQGETVVASSGDDGSTDCAEDTNLTTAQQQMLAVDYPASSPYVTGMGGTEFPVADVTPTNTTYWTSAGSTADIISSAKSYIPEQVWNDDAVDLAYNNTLPVSQQMNPISAGGGGVSLYEVRPYWQTGVPGIPTGTTRLVPDISLAASPDYPGYLFCSSDTKNTGVTGSCTSGFRDTAGTSVDIAGGTSFDAPIFAGLLAIINQAKGYTTGQGVINPTLYSLAANAASYATIFHDITSGGNECDIIATYCGTGAETTDYGSTTGYDPASGLGSIDFNNLLTAWPTSTGVITTSPSFKLAATNVTVASGASTTGTITITPANGYTGTVNLTVSDSGLTDGCVTLSPTSVAVTGTAAVTASYTVDTSSSACSAVGAFRPGSQKTASLHPVPHPPNSPWRQMPVPFAFAGVFLLVCSRRRSRTLRASMIAGLLLILCFSGMTLTGCNGSSVSKTTTTTTTDTQPATYTVTVTGTDSKTSTATASASFTVTVSQALAP